VGCVYGRVWENEGQGGIHFSLGQIKKNKAHFGHPLVLDKYSLEEGLRVGGEKTEISCTVYVYKQSVTKKHRGRVRT